MPNAIHTVEDAIAQSGPRPANNSRREDKKNYSERVSNNVAIAVAHSLREMGLRECQPDQAGGKERQFAGGIGAKKVDVSFATETGGLILGISVKSICFPDGVRANYAKNFTNRRGDLLAEATTLHQRFPYAVLGGLFVFHDGADKDGTPNRTSTFRRALEAFRMFSGRTSRSNAVEMYEALAVAKFSAEAPYEFECQLVGAGEKISLDTFLRKLIEKVAERNSDHYRFTGERIESV